jgi:hypothetical protein
MIDLNPHKQTAQVIAFALYILAGLMLVAGILFTIASALLDPTQTYPDFGKATPQQMGFITCGLFLIIALMMVLFGRRIQLLFGQHRPQDKLAAKAAVAFLRLGSLGCGLWALLSLSILLVTTKRMVTGQDADNSDIVVGISGFALIIIFLQAVAWFIKKYYTYLTIEDRKRILYAYQKEILSRQSRLNEPEQHSYVQERTMDILDKLDAPLKGELLRFLSESGFLSGALRITLRNADFRDINLQFLSLPYADWSEINLEKAILERANLFKVNLYKANLKGADFRYANLQQANLQQADLTGARLENANLSSADLAEAKVTPMQLQSAYLKETVLPNGKDAKSNLDLMQSWANS